MNSVIEVDRIAKRYRIGQIQGYKTVRESLANLFRLVEKTLPARNKPGNGDSDPEHIWALKDVSFQVQPGEIIGIIGRNGAGKSTLLKILTRITEPTQGTARLKGRVSSLLEVGTGFHPELTGRENIYLNGAILGMSKTEIGRKLDEIVDFSGVGVERFIDTPVKRYSSGMYLRLAFAVAAHLEPEILLVDEVLAVGDASFQKKCLGKMESMGNLGRTVLFVSHNMPAVTRLCPRTILLDKGTLQDDGPTRQVVSTYLQSDQGTMASREWPELKQAPGNEIVRLKAVRVKDETGKLSEYLDIRKPIAVEMEYQVMEPGHILLPCFHFINEEGITAFISFPANSGWHRQPRQTGRFLSRVWIPGNFLAEGILTVEAGLGSLDPMTILFDERDAVAFHVVDSLEGTSARWDYAGHMPGTVRPILNWETDYRPPDNSLFPSGNGGQNP